MANREAGTRVTGAIRVRCARGAVMNETLQSDDGAEALLSGAEAEVSPFDPVIGLDEGDRLESGTLYRSEAEID
jgi:hypothetical protein